MPVSLCEWRVRIGTFVRWIRDYEIMKKKERWLKERTRILNVLCERLKEKKSYSKEETEEDDENAAENRQEGSNPTKSRQCPHRTNINSSGSFDIKDLLTSCDQCIHDLLTPSHCCSKDLLTPADGRIKELLEPTDSNVKDFISQKDRSVKDLITKDDCRVKNLVTPDDCSVKDLITTEECSVKDLIAPPDCSVKNFNTSRDFSVKDLITPDDCNISVKDLISPDDCSIKAFLTVEGYSVKDLITPHDSSVKAFITPDDCRVNDLITPDDCSVQDLITPQNCSVKDLITPDDVSAKDLHISHVSTPEGGKSSVIVEDITRSFCNDEQLGKTKEHGRSTSLCHGPSLTSKTALIPEKTPPISELLLLKSGDVELNPGPREWPNLVLERELLSLTDEISPQYYTILCNSLGVGQAGSEAILTKNLLNVPKSLFEIICSWGVKQRDGTDHKKVLADKLRSVHLDALGTKLLKGGYLPQENPFRATDGGQHLDQLTPEQVTRCGQDFKTFYRTWMCKIKTDPLDFEALMEFEKLYTNLVLFRNQIGTKKKTSLEYDDLLTTKINGEFPKRLMIQGEGGSGKTTFCSKIAWDWANSYNAYEQFDWVIVIPMREIQDNQTVGDIAKTYLSDSNIVQPGQIDDYILSKPSKVLIIFDGLDEYDRKIFEDGSDFGKIIRSEKYKECTILVTSRPWKANQIKSHQGLCKIYTFIGVEGFSSQNVSSYINKYFVGDEMAGVELIQFIEDNKVVKVNMAPFPIYVAMLCILWRESTNERREIIRKLKTFSQLFHQMITFLTEHFISKSYNAITDCPVIEPEQADTFLAQVGEKAFSGLLEKQLMFDENVFDSCKEAMEMCTKIGVLSREKRFVQRVEIRGIRIPPVTFSVSFPHKLFQEYLAALYLASLFDSNFAEYITLIDKILRGSVYEFKYLIYFTSSLGKSVGLDIIDRLINIGCEDNFLVDVAFEANNPDTGKVVGERVFAEGKSLVIDDEMPAHTLSGYLLIMEKHVMGKLEISDRSCGPTISRDLADVLSSSRSLTTLILSRTTLHDDFFRFLRIKHVSESKIHKFHVGDLHLQDNQSASHLLGRFISLLPCLTDLKIDGCSFHDEFYKEITDRASFSKIQTMIMACESYHPPPQVAEAASKQVAKFLCSLPCLIDLTLVDYHLHDDFFTELSTSPASSQIQKITIDSFEFAQVSKSASKQLAKFLCSLPCLRDLTLDGYHLHDDFFTELTSSPASSQMETMNMKSNALHESLQVSAPASKQLAKFLCSLQRLNDLTIEGYHLHDDFFTELSSSPGSSQIKTMYMWSNVRKSVHVSAPASKQLAKFLCSLPCLSDLTIRGYHLHDDFFTDLSPSSASLQIKTMYMWSNDFSLVSAPASKQLAEFLCSLPCLSDLTLDGYHLHDDFFTELSSSTASSQIQTMYMCSSAYSESPQVSAPASKQLAKFLCSLPCLKDLNIYGYHLHDDFFTELHSSPASLQIKKMYMWSNADKSLQVSAPASKQLAKFLCSLPCLIDLTIRGYHLHDDVFAELTSSPASSQIQTIGIDSSKFAQVSGLASKQLAKFLCSLPCLKDLAIEGYHLHDDFFTELSSSPASSQIQTMRMRINADESPQVSAPASKQLAKVLCSIPCLNDLTIRGYHLHDDFFTELSPSPASLQIQKIEIVSGKFAQVSEAASKQLAKFLCSVLSHGVYLSYLHVLIEGYHLHDDFYIQLSSSPASSQNRCLREMLEKWRRRQQLQLVLTHEHEHRPLSTERVASCLPYRQQSAQSSLQYPSDHQRGVRSESSQLHQTLVHIHEPSTSGLSSAYSRASSTPFYDDGTPVGRKRIYSDTDFDDYDDDDAATDGRPTSADAGAAGTVSIAESREHSPRKRLAKTDRNPPSSLSC